MDEKPWAHAFVLLSFMAFCCAARTVEDGIRNTPHGRGDQVEAWASIGDCPNLIAVANDHVH